MRHLVYIASYPTGPRCWVGGQRTHHGAVCAVVAAMLARHHRKAAGLLLLGAIHDRHDWRIWFSREGLPSVTNVTDAPADL